MLVVLLKQPQHVPERFNYLRIVLLFSRTAILAPGGWASDRERKRVCGDPSVLG
jgi:hypothetical protein